MQANELQQIYSKVDTVTPWEAERKFPTLKLKRFRLNKMENYILGHIFLQYLHNL